MKHRCSLIATMEESPLAYYVRATSPYEPTAAMRWGSLLDAHLFGYELERWTVKDAARRGKDWGADDVTRDEWESARAAAEKVRSHPRVAEILATGEAQVSLEWQEEGVTVAGRPDFLSSSAGLVLDLKSTSGGLDMHALGSTVAKWRYHIQIALYVMGLEAQGVSLEPAFLFVQSSPPYDCRVVTLVPDQVEAAKRDARRLLRRIAKCEATGVWPGASESIEPLVLPPYAFGPEIEMEAA